MQVTVGRDYGDVPQVGRQEWQFRSHIGTRAVPANQRIDRKTMPKIMNSRPSAGSRANVAGIQEGPQTALQSPCCISFFSVPSIPDEAA